MSDFLYVEYFHDPVRIEELLFEGVVLPQQGHLIPDLTRPGLGLTLRHDALERFADSSSREKTGADCKREAKAHGADN